MKKLIVVAVALVMVMGLVGSASAANSLRSGAMGINVGMGDSIFSNSSMQGSITSATGAYIHGVVNVTGKYMLNNELALLAGFGLQSDTGDADASYFGIAFGIRSYTRVDDFAPFFQGKFTYESLKVDPAVVDATAFDFSIGFGAEYFFHKQFSVEGNVGIGFGTVSDDVTNVDDTYFGTRTVGVSANFYF